MRGTTKLRLLLILALGAITAAALTGSGGATSDSRRTQEASSPNVRAAAKLKIVWVGNQRATTQFAVVMVNGAKAAAKTLGVDFNYRSPKKDFDATSIKQVLELTAAQHPDGMLTADYPPDSLNPAIKAITQGGTPVILVNAGFGEVGPTGSLTYVGNDEFASGKLSGQLLAKSGATHALTLATPPGCQICDDRVNGFVRGFGKKVTKVVVQFADVADATKIKNTIIAALTKDKSINGVYVFGDCCHAAMLAARSALGTRGRTVHWGVIDLGKDIVGALQRKQVEFAIDQQPWLQGYLAVQLMTFYLRYGFTPPTAFIPTGPVVITTQNVARYAALSARGIR